MKKSEKHEKNAASVNDRQIKITNAFANTSKFESTSVSPAFKQDDTSSVSLPLNDSNSIAKYDVKNNVQSSCFKKCFLIVALLKFTFGKTKASFNITHGLAHYFHDLVYNSVLQSDHIVACFDESLNEVVQKGQMDLCVRYWDLNKSRAATRYFDSSFLGHDTANDFQ